MSESASNESIKSVFLRAIELDDLALREQLIEQACGPDETMRATLLQLLAARECQSGNVLDEVVDCFGVDKTRGTSTRSGYWPETVDAAHLPDIERYQICELIGEGGIGAVYVAQQVEPVRRKVALKLIRAGITTYEMLARFSAERQALAMMDHPNIAKVLDGGTTDTGQPYLAMELVPGLPITEFATTHQLSIPDRLRMFVKVCGAVQHAHRKGVIHRDLKPSNILVTQIDGEVVPKVIDFGLAKALDHPLTDNTICTGVAQLLGTPMYMSPEQAEMGVIDVDTRSDVYSLGVLLYELMVEAPPFDREIFRAASFDEVRRMIREVQPPRPSTAISTFKSKTDSPDSGKKNTPPSKRLDAVRGELDWLIMKAMEKDRHRRYGAASELADDIQRYLQGEAISACPPSRLYRLRKTFQRHRLALGAAALVILSLFIISIVSVWQVIEVRRAHLASEIRERRANELLESNQLQSATSAYRAADLVLLSQLTGDSHRQRQRSSLGHTEARSALSDFFQAAADPRPLKRAGFSSPVNEVSVSPTGKQALCVCEDGNVMLTRLDEKGGEQAAIDWQVLGTHAAPAHAVAFSPDGSMAVSGSSLGMIKYWDVANAECLHQVWPLLHGIESLVWSSDGESVAAGSRYHEVWVGDAAGNKKFRFANDQRHESLLFSPDGRELFVPTRQGIQVWDVASAKHIRSIDTSPFSNIRAMCWAGADQQWLVAGERYLDSLAVYDRESGSRRGTFNVGAPYAKSLAASSDGSWIAAGYGDGRVQLIKLSLKAGHVDGVVRTGWIAHQQDDSRLPLGWLGDQSHRFVTAGHDGAVQVWDRAAVTPQHAIESSVPIEAAYLWDAESEPVTFLRGREPDGVPIKTFSGDSADGLVALGSARRIMIVSLRTRQRIATIDSPLQHHQHLNLSPDARRLAAVGGGVVYVWKSGDRWASHELVANFATADDANVVFADDNQTLVCGTEADTGLQELAIESGQVRRWHAMTDPDVVAVSNAERLIAAGNDDHLTVWDRVSDQVLLSETKLSRLWALHFLADDRVLLSGHNDGRIRAWHIPTGQPLGILCHPPHGMRRPRTIQSLSNGRSLLVIYPSEHGYAPLLLGH